MPHSRIQEVKPKGPPSTWGLEDSYTGNDSYALRLKSMSCPLGLNYQNPEYVHTRISLYIYMYTHVDIEIDAICSRRPLRIWATNAYR